MNNISDIFALVTAEDIHTLREESPANFMTLIYKVTMTTIQGNVNFHVIYKVT